MAELKTKQNDGDVAAFIDSVEDEQRRADCRVLLDLLREVTGEEPKMWGKSVVGFGSYHYKYPTGTEGDWYVTGFSPRKRDLTVYVMAGFDGYPELMGKLGKFKTGKSCLYIKKTDDIDLNVLKKLVKQSCESIRRTYG